jgi:hypothetical protein
MLFLIWQVFWLVIAGHLPVDYYQQWLFARQYEWLLVHFTATGIAPEFLLSRSPDFPFHPADGGNQMLGKNEMKNLKNQNSFYSPQRTAKKNRRTTERIKSLWPSINSAVLCGLKKF